MMFRIWFYVRYILKNMRLVFVLLSFVSCGVETSPEAEVTPDISVDMVADMEISIKANQPSLKFNSFLLGTNLLWPFNGEGLLQEISVSFEAGYMDKMTSLSPTALRFPGGDHSDYYFWKDGMGPLTERPSDPRQPFGKINFGTKEFLELCKVLNAEPLITANVVTRDEQYTKDWVKKINMDRIASDEGSSLPKVTFWEIGNEPYLEKVDSTLNLTNAEYISRVNKFISAMREADPTVKVGLPLRLNQYNDTWVIEPSKHLSFVDEVLSGIDQKIDWIAVHSDYRPFAVTLGSEEELYNATMGSANSVVIDLHKMLEKIDTYYPGRDIPIWLTEYNTLYSVSGEHSDNFINSQASAIHITDLLIELEKQPRVKKAHFFSISNNWKFGVIKDGGETLMPSFYALSLFNDLKGSDILDSEITGEQMIINSYGTIYAATVPVVNALATRSDNNINIVLVNKSKNSKVVKLILDQDMFFSSFSQTSYSADAAFSADNFSVPEKTQAVGPVFQNTVILNLPKLSFSKVTLN